MAKTHDRLFVITGATGRTGTTTVRLLLERGHRVRAFVHRQDDRSDALAAAGAEIVAGDLLNFHDVSSATRGPRPSDGASGHSGLRSSWTHVGADRKDGQD